MKHSIKTTLKSGLILSLLTLAAPSFAFKDSKLADIAASKHRTAKYAARDNYRNPVKTLEFFGIKDNMTVVEISPGGGWYTEILAPYLKDNGTYIAAGYDPESKVEYFKKNAKRYSDKLKAKPELYGKTVLSIMQPPEKMDFAKANSADMVLSFRNTHNWHQDGNSKVVYQAIFKALKPGGVFGLVQHRAGDKNPEDTSGKFGYLKQSEVISLAEKVGFKLVGKSEINANPKDTKTHPAGVWSLPPSLDHGEKDKEKYLAIGESDRMTLKFVKPGK